jgi:hypothetical protein
LSREVGWGWGGVLAAFDLRKTPVACQQDVKRYQIAMRRRSTSFNLPRGCSAAHGPTYDQSPRSREKTLRSRWRRLAKAATRKTPDSEGAGVNVADACAARRGCGFDERGIRFQGSPVTKLLKVRMDTWSACAVTRGAAAEIADEEAAGMSVEGFAAEAEVVETDALGTRALGGIWDEADGTQRTSSSRAAARRYADLNARDQSHRIAK